MYMYGLLVLESPGTFLPKGIIFSRYCRWVGDVIFFCTGWTCDRVNDPKTFLNMAAFMVGQFTNPSGWFMVVFTLVATTIESHWFGNAQVWKHQGWQKLQDCSCPTPNAQDRPIFPASFATGSKMVKMISLEIGRLSQQNCGYKS